MNLTDPYENPDQWQHPTNFPEWGRIIDVEYANTDVDIRLLPSRAYLVFDKRVGKAARISNRTEALKLRDFRLKNK